MYIILEIKKNKPKSCQRDRDDDEAGREKDEIQFGFSFVGKRLSETYSVRITTENSWNKLKKINIIRIISLENVFWCAVAAASSAVAQELTQKNCTSEQHVAFRTWPSLFLSPVPFSRILFYGIGLGTYTIVSST